MSEIDPYINYDARVPTTGELDHSLASLTTAYVLVMKENAGRVGYEFESAIDETGTVSIRYGTGSTIFELVGGGAHLRSPATGGVFVGDIYAKSSVAGKRLIAREW